MAIGSLRGWCKALAGVGVVAGLLLIPLGLKVGFSVIRHEDYDPRTPPILSDAAVVGGAVLLSGALFFATGLLALTLLAVVPARSDRGTDYGDFDT
jgi:hypothetical protein